MHLPFEFLQHAAIPAAQALIAGLWQGIALAVVTGLILRLLPGTTASARFAIWTAVFCASAAMPLAHLFTSSPTSAAAPSHLLLDPRWSYLLAAIWFGASLLRLTRLAVEAINLRKLWSEAQPLSAELMEAASLRTDVVSGTDWPASLHPSTIRHPERSLARTLRQTSRTFLPRYARKVQVCSTPDVDRPSVIGFFAPKIFIPDWLCDQLSPTELRHIVLHEMEHLRRRDDWLNLLQKIGLVLFPLNPAMFWIDRRLSTEREIACDDGVLARTKTPRAYAASLTSIAERRLNLSARRRMVALALGAFGTGKLFARRSEFAQRIESILSSVGGQRTAGRPAIAAFLVAAIIGGSAAISHTPELVSFRTATSQSAAIDPAPADAIVARKEHRQTAPARFENATLRLPVTQSNRSMHAPSIPSIQTQTLEEHPVTAISVKANVDAPTQAQPAQRKSSPRQAKPQWLVLSSFEEPSSKRSVQAKRASDFTNDEQDGDVVVPVSRVVLRTPDGRLFSTPYAAVPTQAGWLIVQL
jgi:Zn-dependent protease with chaperone function